MVIVERAAEEKALPVSDGLTESQLLRYMCDRDLSGSLHDLSKTLVPGLSTMELPLAHGVVGGNPGALGTATTGDWIAGDEYTWLRESVEVPPSGTRSNVRDSLGEHSVHGRQAALPARIERSRRL